MRPTLLHRFMVDGQRFVLDTQSCFCFECDHISWDVLEHYPHEPVNRILHLLRDTHSRKELDEVVGELEWLRVTRAILAPLDDKELLAQDTKVRHLKTLEVTADSGGISGACVDAAAQALLARSETHAGPLLLLRYSHAGQVSEDALLSALPRTARAAHFAGKTFRVALEAPIASGCRGFASLREHALRLRITCDVDERLTDKVRAFTASLENTRSNPLDSLARTKLDIRPTVIATPGADAFSGLVAALHDAGARDIVLDMPAFFTARPDADLNAVVESLSENAAAYAERLLRNQVFRVEPFAMLFAAIHAGNPLFRVDPAGVESLAANAAGDVYPCVELLDQAPFHFGSLMTGHLDDGMFDRFSMTGALRTPGCTQCWARSLCGGGYAAVHYRRTGNTRTPDPVWCEAQRRWLEHAVAAFNTLSAAGINFSRLEAAMTAPEQSVSWLSAVKAALRMRLNVRPLREADASWLVQWENWNRAAYFLCNESGLMMSTQYDREMDALHPRGTEQELVLTKRDGAAMGLLKMRPAPHGLAWVWLYLRAPELYADAGVRRSLGTMLDESLRSHQLRRILTPVTREEGELAACLETIGFCRVGTQREALFHHGGYHDVDLYLFEAGGA